MVTSSSTLRACSTTTSASITWWSKTSAVSRITIAVTTGKACAPIAAMVETSPARPPAPLASLALKLITQAGAGASSPVSGSVAAGLISAVMEAVSDRRNRVELSIQASPRQHPA